MLPPASAALLEAIAVPALVHAGGDVLAANTAMERLLGYPLAELARMPFDAWATDETRAALREHGRRCLADWDELPALEVAALTASGAIRVLEVASRAIEIDGARHAVLTAQDLSDMRHVQHGLLEMGQALGQVLENEPIPVFVIDGSHRITRWNTACARLTGLAPHEMLGRTDAWRAFHAEARPMLGDLIVDGDIERGRQWYGDDLHASAVLGQAWEYEGFISRVGAGGRWLHFTAAPLLDMAGRAVGAIETLQDVTERRLADEALRRHRADLERRVALRTAELSSAHRELAAFMTRAPVAIVATEQGRIVQRNDTFRAMFELRAGVGDELGLDSLFITDPAFADDPTLAAAAAAPAEVDHVAVVALDTLFADVADRGAVAQALSSALEEGRSLMHEVEMIAADGRRLWVQLIAYVTETGHRAPRTDARVWWLLQDRSEVTRAQLELVQNFRRLKEINARLEEAQGQLLQSEKLASIGQLAAGVAHEINNPIGFVNSNLGSLRRYAESMLSLLQALLSTESEQQREDPVLQRLKQAAEVEWVAEDLPVLLRESEEGLDRVKKIVQDLKDFSRVDQSEWQQADLNAGLVSTLNVVMNEVKYKAEIRRELSPLPPVRCLAGQLNQVFMNLVVNAAQAIADRGVITLRSGVSGEDAWVEVADTGCGMSPEVQRRIFEPFFTTKPVGKGTGLGLSLSFSIVKKHGGRIDVRSAPGQGTAFRVVVPIAGPPGGAAAA